MTQATMGKAKLLGLDKTTLNIEAEGEKPKVYRSLKELFDECDDD